MKKLLLFVVFVAILLTNCVFFPKGDHVFFPNYAHTYYRRVSPTNKKIVINTYEKMAMTELPAWLAELDVNRVGYVERPLKFAVKGYNATIKLYPKGNDVFDIHFKYEARYSTNGKDLARIKYWYNVDLKGRKVLESFNQLDKFLIIEEGRACYCIDSLHIELSEVDKPKN